MPQMAPLMWTSLFIAFSLLLALTMTKIAFTYITSLEESTPKNPASLSMNLNWKW